MISMHSKLSVQSSRTVPLNLQRLKGALQDHHKFYFRHFSQGCPSKTINCKHTQHKRCDGTAKARISSQLCQTKQLSCLRIIFSSTFVEIEFLTWRNFYFVSHSQFTKFKYQVPQGIFNFWDYRNNYLIQHN